MLGEFKGLITPSTQDFIRQNAAYNSSMYESEKRRANLCEIMDWLVLINHYNKNMKYKRKWPELT